MHQVRTYLEAFLCMYPVALHPFPSFSLVFGAELNMKLFEWVVVPFWYCCTSEDDKFFCSEH